MHGLNGCQALVDERDAVLVQGILEKVQRALCVAQVCLMHWVWLDEAVAISASKFSQWGLLMHKGASAEGQHVKTIACPTLNPK